MHSSLSSLRSAAVLDLCPADDTVWSKLQLWDRRPHTGAQRSPLSDCEGLKSSPCADAWCEVSVQICLDLCFMGKHLRPGL